MQGSKWLGINPPKITYIQLYTIVMLLNCLPADIGLVDAFGVVEEKVRDALALDKLERPGEYPLVKFGTF